jgi:flagellar biosynthesis chaperone FliJ
MRPRTRLDPVIKIEEKNEERKLHEMAAANRKVKSAEEALLGARDAARTDHRRSATATDWLLAEIAHTRALSDVRNAERAVKSATVEEGASRVAYTAAHSKAEALRRVAQARVDEILTARAKAESRELDDIGLVTFNSQGGSRVS